MQAWEQFLQQQEAELGSETVQKWLRTLKFQLRRMQPLFGSQGLFSSSLV